MTEQFTIVRHNPRRWFAWRDVVSILLGLTILILVVQVGQLRRDRELDRRQLRAFADQIARKDARIDQLTDLLVRKGIPVPAEPAVVPSLIPTPTPTPGLTPSPPGPSPHPQPGRSSTPRPRPTHSPSASPSPACALVLAGTCLTPPATPALPPFRA